MRPIPFDAYLVRPVHQQGESLAGWIYRHYGANGQTLPYYVRSKLSCAHKRLYNARRRQIAIQELKSISGGRDCVEAESWVFWCDQEREWTVRYFYTFRFCPLCLREWKVHLELWSLPGINACPRHEVKILDHCTVCGQKTTRENTSNEFICGCGQDLAELPTEKASTPTLRFACSIAACKNVPLPANYYFSYFEETDELDLKERFALLSWLVRTARRQQRKIYKPLTDNFHEITPRECRWICNWPHGWRRLSRLYAHHAAAGSDAPTVRISGERSLAPFLTTFLKYVYRFGQPELIAKLETDLFSYVIVAHGDLALLVNPRRYPTGRDELLGTFAEMWKTITWDLGAADKPAALRGNFPSSEERRRQAFEILQALFFISDKGIGPPELARCWIPSKELQKAQHPAILPRRLFKELYALHPRLQRQIFSLLQVFCGVSAGGADE